MVSMVMRLGTAHSVQRTALSRGEMLLQGYRCTASVRSFNVHSLRIASLQCFSLSSRCGTVILDPNTLRFCVRGGTD